MAEPPMMGHFLWKKLMITFGCPALPYAQYRTAAGNLGGEG
jgi:hypothetical protein